jgi:hypothetical protein
MKDGRNFRDDLDADDDGEDEDRQCDDEGHSGIRDQESGVR